MERIEEDLHSKKPLAISQKLRSEAAVTSETFFFTISQIACHTP
jgi:hypothetical protein